MLKQIAGIFVHAVIAARAGPEVVVFIELDVNADERAFQRIVVERLTRGGQRQREDEQNARRRRSVGLGENPRKVLTEAYAARLLQHVARAAVNELDVALFRQRFGGNLQLRLRLRGKERPVDLLLRRAGGRGGGCRRARRRHGRSLICRTSGPGESEK